MFKRLFTAATVFGIAATAPPLYAQVSCAPREVVVAQLSQNFSEQLAGAGIQNSQRYVEIWAAPETGTFTVLLTSPDGRSCIVASGRNWTQRPLESVVADTPS